MFDSQNRLMVWNQRYLDMYKLDPGKTWRGSTIRDLLDARIAAGTFPLDAARYDTELSAALKNRQALSVNLELADGRIIAVINQPTAGGGWVATHEDITESKRAERELENTRSFLDSVVENVPSPIIVKELPSRRYILLNRAAEQYLGIGRDTMLGKVTRDVLPASTAEIVDANDLRLIETGEKLFFDEHAVVTPGNGTRISTATRLLVKGLDDTPKYLISVINDVTDRKRSEQRIAHMTHHDTLTELPNRLAFNSCIDATLELAGASGESFALLSIDLDHFKSVNDVFGHMVGDSLLREVALRMESVCQGAFLARIGGDEFAVITPTGDQPAGAEALAKRLNSAFVSDMPKAKRYGSA